MSCLVINVSFYLHSVLHRNTLNHHQFSQFKVATFILRVMFFKTPLFQSFVIDHQSARFPSQNLDSGVHKNKYLTTQWIPKHLGTNHSA